jgi:hypothetical protein
MQKRAISGESTARPDCDFVTANAVLRIGRAARPVCWRANARKTGRNPRSTGERVEGMGLAIAPDMDARTTTTPRIVADEWGFFDPDQAGIAAVLDRLDARRTPAAPSPDDARRLAASMQEAARQRPTL